MQGKEQLDTWGIKEYFRNICMILMKVPMWCVQILLFWLPIKKNRIIFYSLKQHGYSCNLKYLTEYIKQQCGGEFEILWIVRNRENFNLLKQHGIPTAMLYSKEHFFYRMKAGIVVTNDEFYPIFLKKKKQLYVNTWHGGINYKKIGYDGIEFTNRLQKYIYSMNNPCPDIFISGSQSFTKTTSKAFGFPENIFWGYGMPRNDLFFQSGVVKEKIITMVKRKLNIPERKKILLYAPTFRRGRKKPDYHIDYNKLSDKLSERFGGEWIILLRQHYFVNEKQALRNNKNVIDVSSYEDMQELILCCDCMISDYSSCMWDFIISEKPCFVYAEDLNEYSESDRSFAIPLSEWPYPVCKSADELYEVIEKFDLLLFRKKVKEHRENCGSYDHGYACKRLVDRFNEYVMK